MSASPVTQLNNLHLKPREDFKGHIGIQEVVVTKDSKTYTVVFSSDGKYFQAFQGPVNENLQGVFDEKNNLKYVLNRNENQKVPQKAPEDPKERAIAILHSKNNSLTSKVKSLKNLPSALFKVLKNPKTLIGLASLVAGVATFCYSSPSRPTTTEIPSAPPAAAPNSPPLVNCPEAAKLGIANPTTQMHAKAGLIFQGADTQWYKC